MKSIAKCRSCGSPINWIRTVNGKWMPVNPGPRYYHLSATGEKFINRQGLIENGIRCSSTAKDARVGFRPHWIDCPGAKHHRFI